MTDTNNTAPKTTAELLEAARARVAKLEQRLVTEQVLASIAEGMTVDFRFGRNVEEKKNEAGEVIREARQARILTGTVVGVRDATVGEGDNARTVKQVKVRSGEGFDAQDYVIRAQDITKVGEADTSDQADEASDEAADPLAAE